MVVLHVFIRCCVGWCSDPNGAMLAFYDMMKKSIVMPAHLMDDLEHETNNAGRNLFKDFSSVAQSTETYTGKVSPVGGDVTNVQHSARVVC